MRYMSLIFEVIYYPLGVSTVLYIYEACCWSFIGPNPFTSLDKFLRIKSYFNIKLIIVNFQIYLFYFIFFISSNIASAVILALVNTMGTSPSGYMLALRLKNINLYNYRTDNNYFVSQ